MLNMEEFRKGRKIKVIHMFEEDNSMDGAVGVIDYVDAIGNVHINWDNGRGLALVPEKDEYVFLDE